jgi:hypothetical protein
MTITLGGCSRAQESFLSVQTCVADQQGVAELKDMMRSTAQSEGLQFIDNSAQQASALKDVGADKALKRDVSRAIDVHIEGKDGLGVTAGNLGLPPYQVALGFTEGADPAKAHRLSDRLVQTLSQRWHVEVVPAGEGAMPMKTCGG